MNNCNSVAKIAKKSSTFPLYIFKMNLYFYSTINNNSKKLIKMLPSLALKLAKAEAHNSRLKTDKKYSKKVSEKMTVTSDTPASWINSDGSTDWKKYNDFLDRREQAKIDSVS